MAFTTAVVVVDNTLYVALKAAQTLVRLTLREGPKVRVVVSAAGLPAVTVDNFFYLGGSSPHDILLPTLGAADIVYAMSDVADSAKSKIIVLAG